MFISCFLLRNDEGKEEGVDKGGKVDEDEDVDEEGKIDKDEEDVDVDEGGWLICNFLKLFNVFK